MSVSPDSILTKDANDVLVFVMDWTDWIGSASIASSTWTISEAPDAILTKDNAAIVTGNKKTTVRLLAGTLGKRYRIACQITTNETPTQTAERSFYVQVVDS